jgi:hypothetical protein
MVYFNTNILKIINNINLSETAPFGGKEMEEALRAYRSRSHFVQERVGRMLHCEVRREITPLRTVIPNFWFRRTHNRAYAHLLVDHILDAAV